MLEFRSPIKKEEKVITVKETISFSKKAKVTTILLPDNYSQEKGSKLAWLETTLEGQEVQVLTEWKEGYPEDFTAKYNIGENSINSAPMATKLQELFDIDETKELICKLQEVEGIKLLIITGVKGIEEKMEDSETEELISELESGCIKEEEVYIESTVEVTQPNFNF